MEVVANVTVVFANRTPWPDLHDKAPLEQGIAQQPPYPHDQGGCGHDYHCGAQHAGQDYDQIGSN